MTVAVSLNQPSFHETTSKLSCTANSQLSKQYYKLFHFNFRILWFWKHLLKQISCSEAIQKKQASRTSTYWWAIMIYFINIIHNMDNSIWSIVSNFLWVSSASKFSSLSDIRYNFIKSIKKKKKLELVLH